MTDWKGNEIEPGQTVLLVSIKSQFAGSEMKWGIMMPDKTMHYITPVIMPEENKWEVRYEYQITEPGFRSAFSLEENKGEIPINIIDVWIRPQPHQIVCIKGISDSQEEFFRAYFEVM